MLMINACSRPPITIKSHDLHVSNIREAMGEMASYLPREGLALSLFVWFLRAVRLLAFRFFPPLRWFRPSI